MYLNLSAKASRTCLDGYMNLKIKFTRDTECPREKRENDKILNIVGSGIIIGTSSHQPYALLEMQSSCSRAAECIVNGSSTGELKRVVVVR